MQNSNTTINTKNMQKYSILNTSTHQYFNTSVLQYFNTSILQYFKINKTQPLFSKKHRGLLELPLDTPTNYNQLRTSLPNFTIHTKKGR